MFVRRLGGCLDCLCEFLVVCLEDFDSVVQYLMPHVFVSKYLFLLTLKPPLK